jgi:hypothetical protein
MSFLIQRKKVPVNCNTNHLQGKKIKDLYTNNFLELIMCQMKYKLLMLTQHNTPQLNINQAVAYDIAEFQPISAFYDII